MYTKISILVLLVAMTISLGAVDWTQTTDWQMQPQKQHLDNYSSTAVPTSPHRNHVGEYVNRSKNGYTWESETTEHITYDSANSVILVSYNGWSTESDHSIGASSKGASNNSWDNNVYTLNGANGRYPGAAINNDGTFIVSWATTSSDPLSNTSCAYSFSWEEYGSIFWSTPQLWHPQNIDLLTPTPFLNAVGELVMVNTSWNTEAVWSVLANLETGYNEDLCQQLFAKEEFPANPEDTSDQFGPDNPMFIMKGDLGYVITQGTIGGEANHPYLWYRKTTDGGHTWEPKVKIDSIPGTPIGCSTEYTAQIDTTTITVTWDQSVFLTNGAVTLDNDGNLHLVASMDAWFVPGLTDPQLEPWLNKVFNIIITPDGTITANEMRPWGYHSDHYYNTFEQYASIACDNDGTLVHTWMDAPDTSLYYYGETPGNGGNDADYLVCDIFAMVSTDGGQTWYYENRLNLTNTHSSASVSNAEKYPCLAQQLNTATETGYIAYEYKAAEMDSDDPDEGEHHLYVMPFDYSSLIQPSNIEIPTSYNFFTLHQNSPNPFNPETQIAFNMDQTAHVELAIYNVKGQKVKTLINEEMQAGNHAKMWNGTNEAGQNVASGVYFYALTVNNRIETKKMVLIK